MDWLIWVVLPSLFSEIRAVNLNPFAGFADQQYEPVADYSIHRGVYLPNMPTTSIFPIMTDENINGMVGIPSLQNPFINPLLSQQQSLFTMAKQNVRTKPKNARHPGQHPSGSIREQVSQQKPRGMTLDLRGGGYRLEQPRSQRPYKPPGTGASSVRTTAQRLNGGRNPASSVGRKHIQRPRNPAVKTHPNMKTLSSIPSNVEFVNPENVLPLHPRIYKQFLQQNPQAAAYLRAQKTPNFAGNPHSNHYDAKKQISSSKPTRNRVVRPNSHGSSLSSLSNVPNTFQIPPLQQQQQAGMQLNFGLHGQSALTQGRQPTFEDFYNSDPQFYASLSQTPEGKAMLTQMYQHFGPSANKQSSNSPSKTHSNTMSNANPFAQTYADINNYATSVGYAAGGNLPSGQAVKQFANNYGVSGSANTNLNKQNLPDYAIVQQYNQKQQLQTMPQQPQHIHHQPALQQQPVIQQQPVLQHQIVPQQQQQPILQQPVLQHQQVIQNQPVVQLQRQPQGVSHSSNPSAPQLSEYSARPQYTETVLPPEPTSDPKKTTYALPQSVQNQYNPYSVSSYSDDSSSFANGGTNYDPSTYQSPYQENPKVVDGSTIDHSNVDHTAFSSSFSPVDPLATIENTKVGSQSYYNYPSSDASTYSASSSRYPSTALHEITPVDIAKRPSEPSTSYRQQPSKTVVNAPGYWTPEQLFAPQSTGLQNESPFPYPSSSSNQQSQDEQQDGSERAALHLADDASSWPVVRPHQQSVSDYSEASELEVEEGKVSPSSIEQPETTKSEEESEERFKQTVRDLQKLWTRVPQRSSAAATRATTVIYRSTEPPVQMLASRDELRNHKTTPSYTFQYSPSSDKTNPKSTAAWWSRKPDGTRYKIPAPQPSTTSTTTSSTTSPSTTTARTTTSTTTTTTTTETPEPTYNVITTTPVATSFATSTSVSDYQDSSDDTPICAKHNNLTYCLQDPEYPKEAIREAIERNRHPLDHFLVDISSASNIVDDQSLHSVFENSAPLQSTSVSYSFEGKVISPNAGEMNSTGCNSNVYYAKPLRALNTAGQWRVIVNVEFEDTGANYTQTVRIEECTHPPGYVATCGTHSISACLQQYKLYRLLSWEAHRGFYIDAFLLPVACFCGSQDS